MQVVSNYVLLESKVKEFSSKVNLLFSRATERCGGKGLRQERQMRSDFMQIRILHNNNLTLQFNCPRW